MLRAPSRLLAQLTLASDLVLIAGCWVAAYILRFHLVGPFPIPRGLPPFQDYTVQLLPILAVWTVTFRTFGLYRPRRLGSYLSEWIDIAKASSVGVLVLIATMTFFFRPLKYRFPFSSSAPRSPVRNHPSTPATGSIARPRQ